MSEPINDPLLDRKEILKLWPHLPISRTNLPNLIKRGFPPPIKLSNIRRVWRKSAVAAYVEQCEREQAAPRKKGRR